MSPLRHRDENAARIYTANNIGRLVALFQHELVRVEVELELVCLHESHRARNVDLQPGSQEARTKVNLLSRARGKVSDEIVPDHWVAAKDGPKVRVRELVPVFDDTRVAYRAVFHIGASLYA